MKTQQLDPKLKHWTITALLALILDALLISFILSLTACFGTHGWQAGISVVPIAEVHDTHTLTDKRK